MLVNTRFANGTFLPNFAETMHLAMLLDSFRLRYRFYTDQRIGGELTISPCGIFTIVC